MPKKQEQEDARTEVSEVGRNILRMELPISMPGLGHVNMYALLDDEGATVVDPGLPGPSTWKAIQHRLKQAGLKPKDVHTIIVTHSHPDHFGGANKLQKESGGRIIAHADFRFGVIESSADHSEVSVDDLSGSEDDDDHRRVVERWKHKTPWGGEHPRPGFRTRLKWRAARMLGKTFIPTVTHKVKQGDPLTLAGREWFVTHTPGHTEDHICLHCPEEGLFLAGDHVLPSITPHISGLALSKDPLDNFFDSLDRVGALEHVELALPAHGNPFGDLAGRAQAIKEHHFERLEKVKSIGQALGPSSVRAFSEKLFRPRSWGGMAESETFAHLEHLRIAGDAEVHRNEEGLLIYETE